MLLVASWKNLKGVRIILNDAGVECCFCRDSCLWSSCLDALLASPHHLQAIYTQPDRPAGRGRKMQASPVKEWALAHDIPVYQPLNFKQEEAVAELVALQPDVLVVIAYGLLLPPKVLAIPRLGCINVHASLLPVWRGASPIQHAILHGDACSGVTIMQMDAGLDTGAMIEKVCCDLSADETAATLHDKLAAISAAPLLHSLHALMMGEAHLTAQDNTKATYAGKINKEDARIDWQKKAQEIDCQIRAFNPWPIAYTSLDNETVRIHEAAKVELKGTYLPGTVVAIDKKGMLIAAGEQGILIQRIQFSGGKPMAISDWLNAGKALMHVGSVLK